MIVATLPISSCALLCFLTVGELDAQRTSTAPTFQTSSQMVLVPVTVTDHYGKTIESLKAQDFNIFDNQKPQEIVTFANEDVPCSVGLVLDISGSMQKTLSAAKAIADAFFGTANPDDEFLLLTASTQPEAMPKFTANIEALEENIGFAKPGGFTALIDTVYLGLSRMKEARRPRRALLILSDGMDNHSRYSQNELLRLALEADAQVYTMIFDGISGGASTGGIPYRPSLAQKPWDQAHERQGPELLEKLSDKTGGLHFHIHNNDEAKDAVVKAGRALRNQYLIGYHPPDLGASGKWHQIRVKSNVPKVNVHARNGYYSPEIVQ